MNDHSRYVKPLGNKKTRHKDGLSCAPVTVQRPG
jgi:hypothetical protein